MANIILATERLLLRKFTLEDVDLLVDLFGDPEVMKYSSMGVLDREQIAENQKITISKYSETGAGFWAVIEKSTGQLVGRIGLPYLTVEGESFFEVAYRLKRAAWGKGFATEAGRACADYAFTKLSQPFVRSMIHQENKAAIRVAERLGMRLEKTLGEAVLYRLDKN